MGKRETGILGLRLGPVRRAIYGFLGESEHKLGSEPASTLETQPADELERMADRAAKRYRETVERATERYKKRWTEAMRK